MTKQSILSESVQTMILIRWSKGGALDEKLRIALEHPEAEITILYFELDERKSGGAYINVTGRIRKIDDYERLVILQNGLKIPIEDIMEIGGELFNEFDGYNP